MIKKGNGLIVILYPFFIFTKKIEMAISPKLCITYERDGSQITIKDETGVYTENNTGGYGTPNNNRNEYAAVLRVYYQPYDSEKKSLLSLDNSVRYGSTFLNSEESTYIVPYFKDGWYIYNYILIPTTLTAPEPGNIIYDTNSQDLRQYDDDLDLVEVFDESELLDVLLYEQVKIEEIRLIKLKIKKAIFGKDYFNCSRCKDCSCDEEFKILINIDQGISSIMNQFQIAKYEAQKMTELLLKQYKI